MAKAAVLSTKAQRFLLTARPALQALAETKHSQFQPQPY